MTKPEITWLVELHFGIQNKPALYLCGDTPQSIAKALIEADDAYGEFGTNKRMAKCWTPDPMSANQYDEAGAKQTASAIDRCCGGVAVAAEHIFNCGASES